MSCRYRLAALTSVGAVSAVQLSALRVRIARRLAELWAAGRRTTLIRNLC